MKHRNLITLSGALAALMLAVAPCAIAAERQEDPQNEPFRIVSNLYYVGGTGHGAYLVATPQGLILINSNFPDSPPLLRQSVEKLGFKWSDIKILLIAHAHIDHDGGSAQIIKETGAKYAVMDGDVDVVETGGRADYREVPEQLGVGGSSGIYYPIAKVDRVLHDGDKVELGGTTLTAHLTPGHTKGTTTWTMDAMEGGRLLHVMIIGGSTPNRGMKLIGNTKYPNIVEDYKKGFAVMLALPCDIPLGSHDWYFDLGPKYKRFAAGDKNAFIDPKGCRTFVQDLAKDFDGLVERAKTEAAKAKPAG